MGIRRLFVIWTFILLALNGAFLYFLWEGFSFLRLVLLEGLVVGAFLFLGYFYRQVIRPLDAIGNGIDFLKEQDFSSRLRKTGQRETDRIVELFNKMIARLKEERLRSEERNRFLDLLVQASPMGIILLDGDGRIMSLNPSALRFLEVSSETSLVGKRLVDSEEPLLVALGGIPLGESTSIRMSDARIYQGSAAFFMDRGVQRRFFMVEELTREMFEIERKAYEKHHRPCAYRELLAACEIIEHGYAEDKRYQCARQKAYSTKSRYHVFMYFPSVGNVVELLPYAEVYYVRNDDESAHSAYDESRQYQNNVILHNKVSLYYN